MKMNKTKKGFTIVELVIVIAIIAILAAVLIPTFANLIQKSKESADAQLVKNLNIVLTAEYATSEPKNFTEVLEALEANGYNVVNLTPRSGKDIVWNQKTNKFELLDSYPAENAYQYWRIYENNDTINNTYSVYLADSFNGSLPENNTFTVGFDLGNHTNYTDVKYVNNAARNDVIIRTYGDQTTLTVKAPNDDIFYYGFAKEIVAEEVKPSSLHIYGATNSLKVQKGHVAIESTGIVFNLNELKENATITNNGYIAAKADTVTKSIEGKAVSTNFEIGTLAQLEAFRDAVNAGNNFKGLTIKLTADIKLNDGWKPIGEGSRAVGKGNVAATNVSTFFRGIFDGNGKTISNLNNKNFVPTTARLVKDNNVDTYAYGLFALVGDGATIRNLTLTNVDIDTTRYPQAIGDSVAALIGYADGSLTVENVTVNGSVKAADAISGIVGRIYTKVYQNTDTSKPIFKDKTSAPQISVTNCTNNATINGYNQTEHAHAAGIIGYIYSDQTICSANISNNRNTGDISVEVAKSPEKYIKSIYDTDTVNCKIKFTESDNNNTGTLKYKMFGAAEFTQVSQ